MQCESRSNVAGIRARSRPQNVLQLQSLGTLCANEPTLWASAPAKNGVCWGLGWPILNPCDAAAPPTVVSDASLLLREMRAISQAL